jgi:hypothetical protein
MKRKMILGSDFWTDCDDAVAMRLLARAHRKGEIELLGVCLNACMPLSLVSCDAFLSANGVTVPIALDLRATGVAKHTFQQILMPHASGRFSSNADAEEPIRFYRRLLAASDSRVEILEIGFMQVLADLLDSPPDDLSPLDGESLVREKVAHLWVMGGKWDVPIGAEHNFNNNPRTRIGASELCRRWPGEITFLGFEVGFSVLTGGELAEGDLLRDVLVAHGSGAGRSSWDPMLVLLALTRDLSLAGYTAVCGRASVDPESGENRFAQGPDGPHRYVVKAKPDSFYSDAINRLIASDAE